MSILRSRMTCLATCALAFSASPLFAATDRVTRFETGEPGTDQWEDLSFQVQSDGTKEISSSHGRDRTEVKVQSKALAGSSTDRRLHLVFADGRAIDVTIKGQTLQIDDGSDKAPKSYVWAYEGPVDGRGTFCTPCVEEKDAIPFVRKNFMQ